MPPASRFRVFFVRDYTTGPHPIQQCWVPQCKRWHVLFRLRDTERSFKLIDNLGAYPLPCGAAVAPTFYTDLYLLKDSIKSAVGLPTTQSRPRQAPCPIQEGRLLPMRSFVLYRFLNTRTSTSTATALAPEHLPFRKSRLGASLYYISLTQLSTDFVLAALP